MMMENNSAKYAVSLFGSVSATARAIGLTRQAVSAWKRTGRVPSKYVALIKKLKPKAALGRLV
jgi:hypothetical protein